MLPNTHVLFNHARQTMRQVLLFLCVSASSVAAQSSRPVGSGTMVTHKYDAAADVVVRLLDREKGGTFKDGLRLRDVNADVCAATSQARGLSQRGTTIATGDLDGLIGRPSTWTQNKIPAFDGITTGPWSRMIARLADSSNGPIEKRTQAYVSYGSQEGFPDVLLMKGSKVSSVSECRTVLSSGQPAYLLEALVETAERGVLRYVLGYAQLGEERWVSMIGSSASASGVAELNEIFRGIALRTK